MQTAIATSKLCYSRFFIYKVHIRNTGGQNERKRRWCDQKNGYNTTSKGVSEIRHVSKNTQQLSKWNRLTPIIGESVFFYIFLGITFQSFFLKEKKCTSFIYTFIFIPLCEIPKDQRTLLLLWEQHRGSCRQSIS